jgi:hypothetical protein
LTSPEVVNRVGSAHCNCFTITKTWSGVRHGLCRPHYIYVFVVCFHVVLLVSHVHGCMLIND